MNQTEKLLLEREYQGLKNSYIFKIMYFLSMVFGAFSAEASTIERVFSSLISILLIVFVITSLILIRKRRHLTVIGVTGAVLDVIFIGMLNIIWYVSVGGADITPGYLLKTTIVTGAFSLLIVNSLALKPLYPTVFAIGFVIVQLGFFIYAVNTDPSLETNNFMDHIMGDKVNYFLFFSSDLFIPLIYGGGGLFFLTWIVRNTVKGAVNLQKENTHMQRYFSPKVVDKITKEEEDFLKPGGIRQNVAVMFCDIRGFTTMSETLPPEEVVDLLSEYHKRMVDVLFSHNGTLDKYIGDAIMATFGTPETADDDVDRALKAAVDMRKELIEFNRERKVKGLIEINHGIAINYGEVIVGNIGTKERLEYTVIGDTVNVASRMEALCKKFNIDIIITESVKEKVLSEYQYTQLKEVPIRGKSETMTFYGVN